MKTSIITSGKRKTAIARATITEGTGKVFINKIPYKFFSPIRKMMIDEPLLLTQEELGDQLNFDVRINARGGGQESQIDASRLALARAILAFTKSEKLKKKFLAYDRNLLVADVRRKEAYKPGDSKARAKRQKSYR